MKEVELIVEPYNKDMGKQLRKRELEEAIGDTGTLKWFNEMVEKFGLSHSATYSTIMRLIEKELTRQFITDSLTTKIIRMQPNELNIIYKQMERVGIALNRQDPMQQGLSSNAPIKKKTTKKKITKKK